MNFRIRTNIISKVSVMIFALLVFSCKDNHDTQVSPADLTLEMRLSDALCSREDKLLYLIEKSGRISIFNTISNTVTHQVNAGGEVGYATLGVTGTTKELYVPVGYSILVYDALSLERLDSIPTKSWIKSIAANNGQLFAGVIYPEKLVVYNRRSGKQLSATTTSTALRVKTFPFSKTELVAITPFISPTDQHYYEFDDTGKLLSDHEDLYHGDYNLDASIFEVFPDGNRFISSIDGVIYAKDLSYINALVRPPSTERFVTFALDAKDHKIYGGSQFKNIEIFDLDNYLHYGTIKTKHYPYKIFVLDDRIICLSQTVPNTNIGRTNTYPTDQSGSLGKIVLEMFDMSGNKL